MIIKRPFWLQRIEQAWQKRTIIWLMGVRRAGKTMLCRSLPDVVYFDCELPTTRLMLADVEVFLQNMRGKRIILDEIHRLPNPSELLKIAADHFPEVNIIATGSSTLGVSSKFRDTLTGRKMEIWLTPMLLQELSLFGNEDIHHRFVAGGLPSFFTTPTFMSEFFREWVDAYWAKDIQDLFNIGKQGSFQRFTELLFAHSGGIFEASRYASPCEVTRQTITHYLAVLEATFIVHVIRPYSSHRSTEIVSAPKVYGFDTGFIAFVKGRHHLRPEDNGFFWEHLVLNELHALLQKRPINYWRDKSGHEIDFVVREEGSDMLTALECKYSMVEGESTLSSIKRNFAAFRRSYPQGKNIVIAYNVNVPFIITHEGLTITVIGVAQLSHNLL